MELDDLRRQWQQPETTPPPVSPAQLESLLVHHSISLIEKKRRNAWVEAVLNKLAAVTLPFYIAIPVTKWVARREHGIYGLGGTRGPAQTQEVG